MRNFHLKFVGDGNVRYYPAYSVWIFIGETTCIINGHEVNRAQADSAILALEQAANLPALGIWDCTLPDGGI